MSALAFELPPELEAAEPPEARGLKRDQVRLMVATRGDGRIVHASFRELPQFLAPGDLLVVNTSGTLPAAVAAQRPDGTLLELRIATPAPETRGDEWWVVELRSADGSSPFDGVRPGECLALTGGRTIEIVAPYAAGRRLWLARLDPGAPLHEYLARHGHPIRYGYVPAAWDLAAYQTAYATEPGSAEMPSAGRPFTPELITRLVAAGTHVAPLTLHTGVSSPEREEAPYPERYEVSRPTARLINAVREWGGRVIAVGTTVVRALETVAARSGTVAPAVGWTNLVVTPDRGLRAVDGLLTGWHEPRASHLQLLEASAGSLLLRRSYDAALEHGYLWHEFGDSHLILP
ncbi:MAG TPA: S-adenosylmethionine:tRNA ribosyltransferase-isomerase [Solirubrobacterales bacterium]|nr:S-adenosylmethionine:tRNA ribosyltransferase-isomerase [Solirubrobacterales bacterium]